MMSAARWSSRMRTAGRLSRTSGLSMAELRMSPASPPVQHTRTVWTPSAWYLAIEPAPLDDSSSGWACTVRMHRGSRMAVNATRVPRQKGQPNPAGCDLPLLYFFFLVTTGFFAGAGVCLGTALGATLGATLGAGTAMNSSATHMALLATTTPTPTLLYRGSTMVSKWWGLS